MNKQAGLSETLLRKAGERENKSEGSNLYRKKTRANGTCEIMPHAEQMPPVCGVKRIALMSVRD